MRIVVVGAGLSGVSAAARLAEHHDVVVLERHGAVGGRLATQQLDTPSGVARFDAGAQFFTVRSPVFQTQVDRWLDAGVAREWCRGFGDRPDGHPRYIGTTGMASLADDLAKRLDVRLDAYVFSVRHRHGRWQVVLTDGATTDADAVLLTCPIPQARALLIETDVELPDAMVAIGHARTLAVMLVLDRPSLVPEPGGVQGGDGGNGVLSFVADNQRKGISDLPALTCHASDRWSADHWQASDPDVIDAVTTAAAQWIGEAAIVATRVRRWRLATPQPPWPQPTWLDPERRVALAGDAFAGPRVEGAYLSGTAAAAALAEIN